MFPSKGENFQMILSKEKILEIFEKSGALLKGHFLLTSGRHSSKYFQCAKVLQHPEYAEKIVSGTLIDNAVYLS